MKTMGEVIREGEILARSRGFKPGDQISDVVYALWWENDQLHAALDRQWWFTISLALALVASLVAKL